MKHVFLILLLICLNSDCISQHRFKTKRDVTKYSENSLDVKIFRSFNNIESGFVNSFVNITNKSIIPVIVAVPIGMYVTSRINDNHYDESSSILLMLSELTNTAVTAGLKYVIRRDRPFRTLNNVNFTDTSDVNGAFSFPSGHTSESFALATSLTLRYPDKPFLISGLYTYATLVSLGRMYWGVHYPSDVLAGMLLGAGSSALIFSLRKPIIEGKNKLFNQEQRTESSGGKINTAFLLTTVIATDLLNHYLSGSQNPVLKKSSVNLDFTSNTGTLYYRLNF